MLDENGASVDPDLEKAMEAEMEDENGGAGAKPSSKPPAIILPGKKPLTDAQRDSLESTLRALMPDRLVYHQGSIFSQKSITTPPPEVLVTYPSPTIAGPFLCWGWVNFVLYGCFSIDYILMPAVYNSINITP